MKDQIIMGEDDPEGKLTEVSEAVSGISVLQMIVALE
jgi:hypothetical protein